jgi:hypothetical protein
MNREDLIKEIFVKRGFKVGAEIGSFKGEFAEEILKTWDGDLYMIDVWRELDFEDYPDGSNHGSFEPYTIMTECAERMEQFGERSTMIRNFSNKTYKLFPDESLDFVFIDANHTYKSVCEDIGLWYPKVKSGGILMGHDYIDLNWKEGPFLPNGKDKHIYDNIHKWYCGVFGVNPAVDEFCERMGYQLSVTDEWFGTWYFEKK